MGLWVIFLCFFILFMYATFSLVKMFYYYQEMIIILMLLVYYRNCSSKTEKVNIK